MGKDGFSWFLLSILVQSHFSVKKIFGLYISFTVKDSSLFLLLFYIFLHQPIGIVGSAAVDTHVSDCFLGQTSRSWKKKKEKYAGENMAERGKKRSSSGTTEPLQLFKWPLSLCTCSLCLVWILKWPPPKKTDIQKMKLVRKARAWVCLTFHISSRAVDEQETVNATACVTLKRKIFLSRMA